MSTEFTIVSDREYPGIVQLLTEAAPRFTKSAEFTQLLPEEHELPSVVCGAFARWVQRVSTGAMNNRASSAAGLFECANAINRLAESADDDVVNALVVDVYEYLHLRDGDLLALYDTLGVTARALYDRWIGQPG